MESRLLGDAGPALRVFLWSRLAIWCLALAAALGFESQYMDGWEAWDSPRLHELGAALDVWARWDSDWYLRIAEDGYSWPSQTPAFFPLYPLLVAALGRILLGHYLLAGVVVSTLAAAAAFVLLHRLALPRLGALGARRAVLYLALFPTSLFLTAVYSESLFLTLALLTFLLAERRQLAAASALAGLAMLTRAQGVALVPALAVYAWRRRDPKSAAAVLLAPAVFLLYPVVLWIWLGKPLAFADAQDLWERHLHPLGPLEGLGWAIADGDLPELAAAAVMLPLAVVAWRRFGAPYGLYALGVLLLPMSLPSDRLGGLYSLHRLALVAFPCFLALAALTRRRRDEVVVAAVFGTLLAVNVVRWGLWYFAG
jgi:hypothetical protein